MSTGLCAEFGEPARMVDALRRVRALGIERLDAHSPFPVDGTEEALGLGPTALPWLALAGGIAGGASAWVVQWWTAAVDAPLDVGGRPAFSGLAYIPLVFELAVLGAALAAFAGYLWATGLPLPWHPVFEIPGFERASVDRFFVSVDGRDPAFDPVAVREALAAAGALAIAPLGDAP